MAAASGMGARHRGPGWLLLLGAVALAASGAGGCRRGPSVEEAARLAGAHDSLTALRAAERDEVAYLRAELAAAREGSPYLVLDLGTGHVWLKVNGQAFDSLAVARAQASPAEGDTADLALYHRVRAAEILTARPARLDADTTTDKQAAVLARIIPPRPKPLRFILHADGLDVRFTASDVNSPWEDLKLLAHRSWGSAAGGAAPGWRVDVVVEGNDLTRLESFIQPGMPLLVRPAPPRSGERPD